MKKKWNYYTVKGMAAATMAAIVTTGMPAGMMTAHAEVTTNNEIFYEDEDEDLQTLHGASPSDASPSNAGIMLTGAKENPCGDDAYWSYDKDTETLTISGEGEMYDFEYNPTSQTVTTPWNDFSDKIEAVVIGDKITNVGNYAFYNYSNLKSVALGSDVKTVGKYAFSGSMIKEIYLEGKTTDLEYAAFYNCENLERVTFAGDVASIGSGVFQNCDQLKDVIFRKNVESIGHSAFYHCSNLETLLFQGTVQNICESAFQECTKLRTLSFPKGVKHIEKGAFALNSGLTEIELQDVESIGTLAFAGCTKLAKVTLGETVPQIDTGVFTDTWFVNNHTKGILVPAGSVDTYKTAWTEWKDYIEELNANDSDNGSSSNPGNNSNANPNDGQNSSYDSDDDDDRSSFTGSTTTSPTTSAAGNSALSSTVSGTWAQSSDGSWSFTAPDGQSYQTTWGYIKNPYATKGQTAYDWFRFDANGKLITSWFSDPTDGNLYYLNPISNGRLGAMLTGWQWIDRDGDGIMECYYFNQFSDGTKGRLYRNTTTPDGYEVNEDGQWIVNGKIQTK